MGGGQNRHPRNRRNFKLAGSMWTGWWLRSWMRILGGCRRRGITMRGVWSILRLLRGIWQRLVWKIVSLGRKKKSAAANQPSPSTPKSPKTSPQSTKPANNLKPKTSGSAAASPPPTPTSSTSNPKASSPQSQQPPSIKGPPAAPAM